MQDVTLERGADAASDHHLVLARMKMKLKQREVKRNTRTQYSVDFLTDNDLLEKGNIYLNTQWQQVKEIWTIICSEVLGKKKYQQQNWISADTVNKECNWGRKRKVKLTTAEREQQKQQHSNSTVRINRSK